MVALKKYFRDLVTQAASDNNREQNKVNNNLSHDK
jgi:hypothetical protein